MMKSSIPVFYAIHPAWTGEMDRMAMDPLESAKLFQERTKAYMGAAAPFQNMAYKEGEVYQISENEFYSFHDRLRYRLTESGARVVIIEMKGLLHEGYYFSDYENLAKKVRAAEDEAYAGVLILANCPGGMTLGMTKLNTAINEYSKPIGCFVSGYLASAAAFVTAGCDLIIGDEEAQNVFGSIGVFSVQQNFSKHHEQEGIETIVFRNEGASNKYKPNSYEPWTDEDKAYFQSHVNADGEVFHAVMKEQRKLTDEQLAEVKLAGTYDNAEAIRLGLCDQLGTLDSAFESIANFNNQLLFI